MSPRSPRPIRTDRRWSRPSASLVRPTTRRSRRRTRTATKHRSNISASPARAMTRSPISSPGRAGGRLRQDWLGTALRQPSIGTLRDRLRRIRQSCPGTVQLRRWRARHAVRHRDRLRRGTGSGHSLHLCWSRRRLVLESGLRVRQRRSICRRHIHIHRPNLQSDHRLVHAGNLSDARGSHLQRLYWHRGPERCLLFL